MGINSKIFRYNAFIRRGVLHYRNTTRPLKGFMAATILRNDKNKKDRIISTDNCV